MRIYEDISNLFRSLIRAITNQLILNHHQMGCGVVTYPLFGRPFVDWFAL